MKLLSRSCRHEPTRSNCNHWGGIGGLAAALALSHKGFKTLLIEQAEEFREVGAGIQVGPNGFRVLETLGVADQVRELTVLPDDLIFMDSVSAEVVTTIPTGAAFRERFKYPYALVHRADLHSVLLAACRESADVDFRIATKVVGYEDDGLSVCVTTDQGETIRGCALIGADGLWSKVREKIVGDGAPVVSGHIAYRAVLPIEDVPLEFRRNSMILWGGGGKVPPGPVPASRWKTIQPGRSLPQRPLCRGLEHRGRP